ncbi:sugar-phosphatase [Clostridium rectalis]|uniref:sugar-phosphatase n=1 Tax=Clostridium rectalis TaxID=2040295 RepID=UPI000F63CBE0|nr:sugar-phosphatase [Clostridium rectalis]
MYKLIALDMDGTLLNSKKNISNSNLTAIKNAKKIGSKVVLATGRPLKGIKKYLKELDLINTEDYCVVFNGAVVQNVKTEEILCKKLLTINDVKNIYDISKDLNIHLHLLTLDSCITPKIGKYTQLESDLNHIPLQIKDFNKLDKNLEVVKVIFADEPDTITKSIEKLPKELFKKFTIVRSAPYFLEFLNKDVNKGTGVQLLAKNLHIPKHNIICVGDAGNDIHMIKYAGLGVAMGNAFPEVKNIADYITLTNDNDGVAHVINKFILNNETAV